jgi:hypothetical protein
MFYRARQVQIMRIYLMTYFRIIAIAVVSYRVGKVPRRDVPSYSRVRRAVFALKFVYYPDGQQGHSDIWIGSC